MSSWKLLGGIGVKSLTCSNPNRYCVTRIPHSHDIIGLTGTLTAHPGYCEYLLWGALLNSYTFETKYYFNFGASATLKPPRSGSRVTHHRPGARHCVWYLIFPSALSNSDKPSTTFNTNIFRNILLASDIMQIFVKTLTGMFVSRCGANDRQNHYAWGGVLRHHRQC
jgi:hypothetical protein